MSEERPPLPAEQPVASTSQPSNGEAAAAAEAAPPDSDKPSAEEQALLKVSLHIEDALYTGMGFV
jgi:hypothetical protein